MTKCYCQCHVAPYPADVRNVVDALAACSACSGAHRQPAMHTKPRIVNRRGVQVKTHDGREMTWDEYQREMENRADAWKHDGGKEA